MKKIAQNIKSMSLPKKWTTTRLKDISEKITKGSTPTSYGYSYKTEGIKFIKTENIDENSRVFSTTNFIDEETNEFLKRSILHENDLLFSIAGTIGRIALIKEADLPANTNQALAIIRTLPGSISHKYLLYYLKSDAIQKKALKQIVGVGRANLSLKNVGEFEVSIAPENEQKRIVAEIEKQFSRLDEAVANLKRVKANLKRYKASVLKAAVEGKLTEEWREKHPDVEPADKLLERILAERRQKWEEAELAKMKAKGKVPKDDKWKKKYKEPSKPDLNGLPKLPEGWIWVTYAQLGEWSGGGTPSKRKPEYWEKGTIPWVSPKDMKTDIINKTIDKITAKAVKESVAKLIPQNSLLFVVRSGILRRTLPIAITEVDVTVNQDLKALTPSSFLNSSYLFLSSQAFSENILHKCQKDGTTVESIEVPALQIFPIPLPPLSEQEIITQEISRRLTVVDNIHNETEKTLKKSDSLRQSILKKAFSGKLVKSMPGEEPATVLLENIQRQREIEKTQKPLSKKGKHIMAVKDTYLTLEEVDVDHLSKILTKNGVKIDPKSLWQESKLTIDDFYAQLKRELEKNLIEETPERLLKLRLVRKIYG